MGYVNNVHNVEGYKLISGFGNTFVCNNNIDEDKTINFPDGWNNDTNLSFKVIFQNGHNCVDDSTNMTLNDVAVVVNKYGVLIPLPIHTFDESGTPVYKSLQPNTVLEMYYTSNYDGADTPAFVIIGNPIVLSDTDYTIYADGQIGNEEVGTIKAMSTNNIPYGWLEANAQAISRTKYSDLFTKYETQTYDSDSTHTLLSKYGVGDGSTTFNLPDYREVALVGVGTNGTNTITTHEPYTLGEFKDDQFQDHKHYVTFSSIGNMGASPLTPNEGTSNGWMSNGGGSVRDYVGVGSVMLATTTHVGSTTRGKRTGVTYLIKVL